MNELQAERQESARLVSSPTALDAGLQWEVMENEGAGPDTHARIAAFTRKGA